MKLGVAQLIVAVVIIVLAMLTPLAPTFDFGRGNRLLALPGYPFGLYSRALAQDDNDEDNDDDDDDNDDDDDDNDDEDNDDDDDDDNDDDDDDDNDDEDNDDDDDDNDDDEDNDEDDDADNGDDGVDLENIDVDDDIVDAGSGAAGPSFMFDPAVTQASGVSTGADSQFGLPGDRLVVRMFSWMPPGVSMTIRLITPTTVAAPPCTVVGPLIFQLEATDSFGAVLTSLPAEVNLSAHYANSEVVSLNRQAITMYWLDPFDNVWKIAPKVVTDPPSNYVAASVMGLGTYTVCAP
jgi:hypothetical protein